MSAINDEQKQLKTNFHKLETDLAISRSTIKKPTQLNLVERKCCANEQNSRRDCLEILGIPKSVQDDNLEDCVLKIFQECNTSVDPANIEACRQRRSSLNFPEEKMCSAFYSVRRNHDQ